MSPKPDADDPRIGAPSPADNPTTPQRPGVDRSPARGRGVGGDRNGRGGRSGDARPADVPTEPARPGALTPGSRPAPSSATDPTPDRGRISPGRTRVGGTWIGFILGAIVLIFLLVFVVQNLVPVEVTFLGLRGTLPLGVWLLFAAVAGVLLLAIPGLGRLVQWRRATRRARQ